MIYVPKSKRKEKLSDLDADLWKTPAGREQAMQMLAMWVKNQADEEEESAAEYEKYAQYFDLLGLSIIKDILLQIAKDEREHARSLQNIAWKYPEKKP